MPNSDDNWPEDVPTDARARYERIARIAFRVGFRLLKQEQAAEDLAHEVWLIAEAHLADVVAGNAEPLRNFDAWVQRVSSNKALKVYRSRWQRILRTGAEAPEGTQHIAPDDEAAGRELTDRLEEAVERLSVQQRQAFELYALGHSYDEIAEATGAPLGTVKVRLHRARARLADLLFREPAPRGGRG